MECDAHELGLARFSLSASPSPGFVAVEGDLRLE